MTIPKAVRDRHGWQPGVELEVEDLSDVVVLRPAKPFPPTTIEEVYGCLKYDGPPVTIEEMDEARGAPNVGRVRAPAPVTALDTDVVVRFLTRDDPAQGVRATALIETGAVFVPRTVVLETEWVLRTIYRFERGAITAGLMRLLGLPGVDIEDRPTVARALEWCGQGLDFADALHFASSGRAEAFATFDRALRRKARGIAGTVPVIAP